MGKIKLTEDEIVRRVAIVLERIIMENSESLTKGDFLVRPSYGYNKFYLNRVCHIGECTFEDLVGFILFEENIYKEILNEKQYAKCLQDINGYFPDFEDDEIYEILGLVYLRCMIFLANRLVSIGLDVSDYFDEHIGDIDYKTEDGLLSTDKNRIWHL